MMETTVTPGSITFTFDRDELRAIAGRAADKSATALHALVRMSINDYLDSTPHGELATRLAPAASMDGAL